MGARPHPTPGAQPSAIYAHLFAERESPGMGVVLLLQSSLRSRSSATVGPLSASFPLPSPVAQLQSSSAHALFLGTDCGEAVKVVGWLLDPPPRPSCSRLGVR